MKEINITFEDFERHLKDAESIMCLQDKLYEAVANYNDLNHKSEFDFGYFPTLLDNLIELLEMLMDDCDNHWISYWMFDLNCGEKYHEGCVTDTEGKDVPLKTIEDLWNVLVD